MGYLYRLTGDRELSEDVLHAVFLYFFENLARYEPRGRMTAYLFRLARSKLSDERRAARRLSEPAPAPRKGLPTPPQEAAAAELERRSKAALEGLSPNLREVVVLRVYEGLDYSTISRIAGISEATARSRMRYALEALKPAFGGFGGDKRDPPDL